MKKVYIITGIDCANCAAKIEQKFAQVPGVEEVSITFATEQLRLTAADPDALIPALLKIARDSEPDTQITPRDGQHPAAHSHTEHAHHPCGCGDTEHEHHHHHHHHHGLDADDVFDSIGIETVNRYTEDDIREALKGLGENIVRAKGIVPAADGSWLFFDYVPGDVDIRTGKAAYTGLITVIGEHVDVENIKTLFRVK